MRIGLSFGSLVETTVTLAAAALMTLAGFAMLEGGTRAPGAPQLARPADAPDVATRPGSDSPSAQKTAMPHVDQTAVA